MLPGAEFIIWLFRWNKIFLLIFSNVLPTLRSAGTNTQSTSNIYPCFCRNESTVQLKYVWTGVTKKGLIPMWGWVFYPPDVPLEGGALSYICALFKENTPRSYAMNWPYGIC